MTDPRHDPHPHADPHDRGLAYDLAHLTARRRVLAGLGAGMILSAGSFGGPTGEGEANTIATGADGAVCIKDPGETAGPYPGDGTNDVNGQTANVLTESGVVRTDIRTSFAGLTPVADGAQQGERVDLVGPEHRRVEPPEPGDAAVEPACRCDRLVVG